MTLDASSNTSARDRQRSNPFEPELSGDANAAEKVRNAFVHDVLVMFEGTKEPKGAAASEESLDFNGTKLTLKSKDGKAVYFKEGTEEWDSKDGELWIKRGTDGLGIWRGKIKFDGGGNLVEEGTSFGVKTVRRKDGSATTSITNKDGAEISLTKFADGKQEFKGATGTWKSDDGRNWHNDGKVYSGQLGIDAYGRYWRKNALSDKIEYGDRSQDNHKVVEKMAELEKKYNVSFGTAGKEVEYEYKDPEQDKYVKVQVGYRFPTLSELKILEGSLNQYAHLAAVGDKIDYNGLRFNFISSANEGHKVSLYGWYNAQKDGVSQISFGPRNVLAADDSWDGLKGTALHEIAHHLQSKLWSDKGTRQTPQKVLDAFGFTHDKASDTYRLTDKDGKQWERHEIRAKDKDSGKWEYRGRWYPVISGTVVKEEGRARTTKEMHDSLPQDKKPCTNYFTYPTEAHAEALSMYLFDRRMLWEKNKKLYESTKSWDQEDINRRYGTERGAARAIRSANGSIVENNEENRRKVREMEESWSKKPPSRSELGKWERAITARDTKRGMHCDDDQVTGRVNHIRADIW